MFRWPWSDVSIWLFEPRRSGHMIRSSKNQKTPFSKVDKVQKKNWLVGWLVGWCAVPMNQSDYDLVALTLSGPTTCGDGSVEAARLLAEGEFQPAIAGELIGCQVLGKKSESASQPILLTSDSSYWGAHSDFPSSSCKLKL